MTNVCGEMAWMGKGGCDFLGNDLSGTGRNLSVVKYLDSNGAFIYHGTIPLTDLRGFTAVKAPR